MDNSRVYGGSDFIALLDNSNNSLWVPSSSPSFHETMVNFTQEAQPRKRLSSSPHPNPNPDPHGLLSRGSDGEEAGGEEFEINPFHHPEKKRRLTPEQVQFLEKNFELENKLEPERKVQLAKELGLHSRQVAIWFQNRRARCKTKQLEKDYESLKAGYDRLKASFDTLIKERDDLQNEAKLLTKKLRQRDMGPMNLDPNSPDNPLRLELNHEEITNIKVEKMPKMVGSNNKMQVEEASSAKSDVFDSESPHCTEGNHSSLLEGPTDSTHLPDPDLQSDSSPDHVEGVHLINMGQSLLFPPTPPAMFNNSLLKVEETQYYDPNGTACSFPLVDEQPVWSWLY